MTDKKLTDDEIIKALTELSRYTGFQKKYTQVLNATLDLIKRQKAEIVNLKDYNEELLAEIRKLKGSTIVDNVTENQERIRREAEAYKAFAEHSKEKWWFNTTRMVGEEE